MSIDPIIPGSGPIIPTEPTPPTAPTLPLSGEITDTTSASALAVNPDSVFYELEQPVYLNVWTKVINLAVLFNKQQLSSDTVSDAKAFKGNRLSAIATAEDALALIALFRDIVAKTDTLYEQQVEDNDEINQATSDYNDAVNANTSNDPSQIATMNAATEAFNSANSDFDQATTDLNQATTTINQATVSFNQATATFDQATADFDASPQEPADIAAYNTAQDIYNTAVASHDLAITAYDTAVTAYATAAAANNSAIIAYNAAIAVYTNYTTARDENNATAQDELDAAIVVYQDKVALQNEAIDEINIDRAEAGIELILYVSDETPTPPDIPGMPAAPSVSNPIALSTASTTPDAMDQVDAPTVPSNLEDFISQYLEPILSALVITQANLNIFHDRLTEFRDYQNFILGPVAGKISFLPAAYVDQKAKAFLDFSSNVGSGAGVSLTSMISGLSDRNLTRVLSRSIAADAALKATIPLPPHLFDELQLINLSLLSRAAIGSGVPAFSQLSERLAFLDKQSPAIQIALSVAFANQIAGLSASDDLKDQLLKRLTEASPTGDLVSLKTLAEALAAASNLTLVLNALSQSAQSLNYPELPGLVLGLINNPAAKEGVASASKTTIADVLDNPSSVANLKADLARALSVSGQVNSEAIAKGLILDDIRTAADLKSSIRNQLIAQDVSPSQASALAARAADFAKAERLSENILDTAITKDLIQKQSLESELSKAGIQSDIIKKVLPGITDQSFTSRRELRDAISDQLEGAGVASFDALSAATLAVRSDQSAVLTYNPLSQPDLATSISSRVLDRITQAVGPKKAQELADQLASSLVGTEESRPLSIVNLIKDQLERLNRLDDTQVAETIRAFLKPTFDLYGFNRKILDPANVYIHSGKTGLMYEGVSGVHDASKDIDIHV